MKDDVFVRHMKLKDGSSTLEYPFNIPAVQQIEAIKFKCPVTFIVGDNGSGKSTILEALAVAAGFNAEGGTKNYTFKTANTTSKLHKMVQLVRGAKREKTGFFLRAESLYNVATESERLELRYGGKTLHNQSHGESFLSIAKYQFGPQGLYIMDEPESALSPLAQLSLLKRMNDLVKQGSQFIVATHSPILTAYPNAIIYNLDQNGVHPIDYEETSQYTLTKDILQNPKAYMRQLLA